MTNAWLVGTFEGTDAAEVPAWAIDALSGASFRRFRTLRAAAGWNGEPADVVLVVQHRPREFAASDIAALIASQPLAQFLVGLGAWCGSSTRSEAAWPESIAVPVWDLCSSLRQIASALEQGDVSPPWQTSGREDVLLSKRAFLLSRAGCAGQVTQSSSNSAGTAGPTVAIAVESVDRVFAESLRDIVGESIFTEEEASASRVTLFDADPLPMRLAALTELRRRRSTDRIIALVDQPTRASVERLKRAGADAVIAKPFRAGELWDSIARFAFSDATDFSARTV